MTFETAELAVDFLLTGACIAVIVLAAVVVVRKRRTGTARLFGRALHRPRLWALATVCMSVSGLLRIGSEVMPSSWRKLTSLIDLALMLAFVVLMGIYALSQPRAKCRRAGEPQTRP